MKLNKFIVKYLNTLNNIIIKMKGSITTFHQKLLQTNVNAIEDKSFKNPYNALIEWCIDIVQYGFILAVIYTVLALQHESNIIKFMFIAISLGLLRWFIFDSIKEYIGIIGHK